MKRRILIVDDIAVNREMLKNILGGEYETAEASNGADALSIIAQGGLSAVLLDLMMPDMDGFDVLVKLRGDSML